MFKNMFKRSWLSVVRKPSRTIILCLVLFAMANLVLAAMAIRNAVNESMAYAKSSLGGTVYLQPDMEKLREGMQAEFQNGQGGVGVRMRISRPSVDVSIAEEIAGETEYVKDASWGLSGFAEPVDFELVESEGGNNGPMIMGGGGSFFSGAMVSGINSYAFIDQVKNGTMSISEGTYFDETTDGMVMVSMDLAEQEGIGVGEIVTMKNTTTGAEVALEVIGIYDVTDDGFNVNTIFMNVGTAAKFLDEESYADGAYGVQNVQFFMNDAGYADEFIEKMQAKFPGLAEKNLVLSVDDSAYQQMVGPIEQVGSFADTVLWVVLIASVAIVTLMVMINVKDRRYEMGVLLSIGATKMNVAGQILAELVLVGTLGFLLSMGTSSFLAQSMGENLLEGQIANSEKESEQNFGRPGAAVGGTRGGVQMRSGPNLINMMSGVTSDAEAIDEINVNVSWTDYAVLFGIGYLVVILAAAIPSINIFRFQPKTILSGKE